MPILSEENQKLIGRRRVMTKEEMLIKFRLEIKDKGPRYLQPSRTNPLKGWY